jgi:hypothetical protein
MVDEQQMHQLLRVKLWMVAVWLGAAVVTFVSAFDWKSRLGNAIVTLLTGYALYLLKQTHRAVVQFFNESARRHQEHDAMWKWFVKSILGKIRGGQPTEKEVKEGMSQW